MRVHRGRVALPIALLLLALGVHAAEASAAAGKLDRSFSRDGLRTLRFADRATGMAIQPDGKILVVGYRNIPCPCETESDNGDFALARLRPSGRLDRSFGRRGKIKIRSGKQWGWAVAVQENGRIVVAVRKAGDDIVRRYRRGGKVDRDFGRRGRVKVDFGGTDNNVADLALQPDGRIVVAGDPDPGPGFALARLRRGGRLDQSFGEGGKVRTDFPDVDEDADSVAVRGDGTIVVAGDAGRSDFAIAQYQADGSPDPSFSDDGMEATDFFGEFDFGADLALDGGRAVVVGQVRHPGHTDDFGLARYGSDGLLDPAFGGDGRKTTEFIPARFDGVTTDVASGVAVQDDGKVIAVGWRNGIGLKQAFALARFREDGRLDRSFSGDGRKVNDFHRMRKDRRASAEAVALDARGRLVVVGQVSGDFAIARYHG